MSDTLGLCSTKLCDASDLNHFYYKMLIPIAHWVTSLFDLAFR